MNWEVPLLLGFLLLFSAWVSFPLTDQYFFIDSNGIKHHILTPEKSDHNDIEDNLTNILFTRYENPWMEYTGINIIFVAGIFIILQQEPVRLYLRNRIWALILFNLEKHSHGHLQNESKVFNLVYRNRNNDLAMWPSLIFFNHKELKKPSKVFFIILSFILFSFYSQDAYAATAQFVDGGQFTGVSTNCASRSTVATLNTSLPAASSSTPNIIIATTDYVSSDAGSEQVDVSSGLYRGGVLSQLQYSFFIDATDDGNHYTYIYEDSTAGPSPTYTIEACLSTTNGNAESKILAIQGLESSFTDGGNLVTSTGSFVDIETLITDLTANDHIIIAQVQIDFDGTATIAAGDIELRDSAGTMLTENEFEIIGASAGIGDGSAITLIAVVPGGSPNTSYKVAVREPVGGGVAGAEAKILALKAAGGEEYFSDGGSVSLAASATQLTSLASSFSNNEKIVVMSASQFHDIDTAEENLEITVGHEIRENGVAKSGNQMLIGELAASGNAGEGTRHTLIWYGSAGGASLGYESRADPVSTGYDGESKLLVFSVQDHIFPSDTPTLSEAVVMNQDQTATDTPTLSEAVVMNQDQTATDTPTLSETVVMTKIIVTSDTPILSEAVVMNQDQTATDTPTLSEAVLMNQDQTATDTPTLSEAVTVNGILSTSDTPFISESVTLEQSLSLTDNLVINDVAVVQKTGATSGGSSGDLTAPSIGSSTVTSLGDAKSGSGVIIGENNSLDNLSQVRPIKVGEKINLRFDVNEEQGINNIAHVSLYIGKGTSTSEVSESDTYIRFEKGKQFEVSDPHKLFSDVSFALLQKDTNNFVFRFDMTFAKPMEKSSILFRTWDLSRNVAEVWYVDALEVMEKEMLPPESLNFGTKNESVNTPSAISADQRFVVEKWAGYNAESISDSDLLKFLGIISSHSAEEDNEVTIPSWFKNNVAEWVLEGKVSFTEFVDAIEYMYEKRIM